MNSAFSAGSRLKPSKASRMSHPVSRIHSLHLQHLIIFHTCVDKSAKPEKSLLSILPNKVMAMDVNKSVNVLSPVGKYR